MRAARALLFALPLSACSGSTLPRETLLDPESCRTCHPGHYREWSGSMHAYAADDPLFLALNAQGQRETNGALGTFCIQCHAPMALREGATDGRDPSAIPRHLKGVTCFFCHTVERVEGEHNNMLALSADPVLRAGIADPLDNDGHDSGYSELHDRGVAASSSMCGSCHDVVTPKGVNIERTFGEWKGSLYAHDNKTELQTCGRCHMPGEDALVADYPGAVNRRSHSHMFAAVDTALIPYPEMEAQRAEVQRLLDTTLFAQMCVRRVDNGLDVIIDLENLAAGHAWPSGSSVDRRAWVELRAFLGDQPIFESGVVPEGGKLTELADPSLWRFGDRFYDDAGQEVHEFWRAARFESEQLIPPTAKAGDPRYVDTHKRRTYSITGIADRITVRVRFQPFGLDIIDALISAGDLDPALRARMPTFDLGSTVLEWTPERGDRCFPEI